MTRTLKKIGNSKGFIMTHDRIDHLGVIDDTIEVSLEKGRIVLAAPAASVQSAPGELSVEQAARRGIEKYRPALDVLAGKGQR